MAEILSPGVFIEEVPSSAQVVQPVSTSNFGIVGGTDRGPTNQATLVTSYDQFTRIFGGLIRESYLPLSMAAYFANGGRRAYVVRVAPSDALGATAEMQSQQTDHRTNVGDGATAAITSLVLTPSPLRDRVVPSSLTFRWRSPAAAPTANSNLRNRLNTADLQGDGVKRRFEGRINPAAIPAGYDPVLPAIHPTAATQVDFTVAAAPMSIVLTPTAVGSLIMQGTNAGGSTARLDTRTGRISIEFALAEIPDNATDIELSFTATDAHTVSDDGLGVLPAGTVLTGPGSVTYLTGAYSFTTVAGAVPILNYGIYATYKTAAWDMTPISVGTWANDMRVEVVGNDDFYTIATDTFSRFNVNVLLLNEASGNFEIIETFEEITFSDTVSPQYFPDVVNELSDLVRITEPANLSEAPQQLNGIARSQILCGGDEDAATRQIVASLPNVPVRARTVSITFTDSTDVARTITDDGAGNLIGDVDPAGTNTIDYTSGAIDVTVVNPIGGATLVTASWVQTAAETLHREQFGDTTKDYVIGATTYYRAGTDGTYTNPTNYGRDQFTNAALLESGSLGMYALNRVEDIMQLAIPDFTGDVQITRDILDYVDGRAALPSGGDRFAILAVPQGSSAQEAVDYFRFDLTRFSKFAALYWPWVKVADPLRDNRPTVFPPQAHIAGIYARTDTTRNVGKSPGGTIDGALRYLTGLELVSTQGERDLVYPNKINPLISSPQTGLAVWGVRTIAQESEWRYINARRLFMFVERSIWNSTFWVVFENNGPSLWARIKAQLNGFLNSLYNEGLFAGSTPAQAFFVTCDGSNNDQSTIDAGQVIIDVGIAPNKPAEFVRFRFQQKTLTSS
jgi:phage tail sheath protein FI